MAIRDNRQKAGLGRPIGQEILAAIAETGETDPKRIAEALYPWFIDAPRSVQMEVFGYEVQHHWSTLFPEELHHGQ